MSDEIKRYPMDEACPSDIGAAPDNVPNAPSILDLLQRKVSILREELAERNAQLAALREELERVTNLAGDNLEAWLTTKQRLAAAEQRNADGRQLLRDWKCLYEDMRWSDATTFAKTEEFLSAKPTESGASE